MAIINFNEADRLSSLVVPTAWYTLEITEIDGPKASKTEKSFSYYVKMQVVKGDYEGKEFSVAFNTKTNSVSLLGTMQYFPLSWLQFQVNAAIQKVSMADISLKLDTDELLRKPFDCKIEKTISEGVPVNALLQFLPEGTGKDATVPF